MEKVRKKEKEKVCNICVNNIVKGQHYCRLTEYKSEKELSEGFYHHTCFRERCFANKKVEAQAKKILDKFQTMVKI